MGSGLPAKARKSDASMVCDANGLPVALDDETRMARKKARNRRAAALSRERRQKYVDDLKKQIEKLQVENADLQNKLSMATLQHLFCDDASPKIICFWRIV